MAFGIDQAGLQAAQAFIAGAPDLIAKLQASGMTVEADLVQGMHSAATDIIAQIDTAIKADLAPLVDESKQWRETVKQSLQVGIVGTIGGIPFTLKGGQ